VTPRVLALAIPSSCRSIRRLVANAANTPGMSGIHFPAAVLVSTGRSAAFMDAPQADDVLQICDAARQPAITVCRWLHQTNLTPHLVPCRHTTWHRVVVLKPSNDRSRSVEKM
jgi:hypothetical protein